MIKKKTHTVYIKKYEKVTFSHSNAGALRTCKNKYLQAYSYGDTLYQEKVTQT